MIVLGIELSSYEGTLSLVSKHKILTETKITGVLEHDKYFIPFIEQMFKENNISLRQLNGIGVSTGPGSFTGIRLGIAAAKGLALRFDIPVLGIPTMDILMKGQEPVLKKRGTIFIPVIQAKRDTFFVSVYKQTKDNHFRCVRKPFLCSKDELIQLLTPQNVILGIGADGLKDSGIPDNQVTTVIPRAAHAALLAEERLESKRTLKKNIKPIYIWEFIPSLRKQFVI